MSLVVPELAAVVVVPALPTLQLPRAGILTGMEEGQVRKLPEDCETSSLNGAILY